MKKHIARIFVCFSIIYTIAALEITVPECNFGVLMGKLPSNSSKFSIIQESSINFRLLHGESFYSDLNLSLYVPDVLRFFYPREQERTPGQFTFIDFSLNFPRLARRALALSIFTGQHHSLTGMRYSADFLKHDIRPVKMYESDISALFTSPYPREAVGVSLAGLISNTGYIGASFGWNGGIKQNEQEYGVYVQGGTFSNTALTNAYIASHITDNIAAISGAASGSVLFTVDDTVNILMQVGLHKTNFRSPTLKKDIIGNLFAFFEPRIAFDHVNLDFTFFASKIRDSQSNGLVSVAPLIKPFDVAYNELYGGLNIFCGFGNLEFDKMQGGFHCLVAMPATRSVNISSVLIAVTPFYTVNIGLCDIDFRCSVYPLLYATPVSMFEGKVAFKRNL